MSYAGIADYLSRLALDDLVLRTWTSGVAPGVSPADPVSVLEHFVGTILFGSIDLRLGAGYVEFFPDHPELRVPLSPGALSQDSLSIVRALQQGAPRVFANTRTNTVGATFTYSRFRGNEEINERFPRHAVIRIVLAKGLCVAQQRDLLPAFAATALCALDRLCAHAPEHTAAARAVEQEARATARSGDASADQAARAARALAARAEAADESALAVRPPDESALAVRAESVLAARPPDESVLAARARAAAESARAAHAQAATHHHAHASAQRALDLAARAEAFLYRTHVELRCIVAGWSPPPMLSASEPSAPAPSPRLERLSARPW